MILGVRKADSAVENQLERCFCRLQGLAVVVSGQKLEELFIIRLEMQRC